MVFGFCPAGSTECELFVVGMCLFMGAGARNLRCIQPLARFDGKVRFLGVFSSITTNFHGGHHGEVWEAFESRP